MRYIFTALLFPLWIIPALICAVFKDINLIYDPDAEEENRKWRINMLKEMHGEKWREYDYEG